jgi:type IV secretory pathway protease TraF
MTRRLDAIEVITSTTTGFVVAWVITFQCLPLFGLHPSAAESLGITAVYTAASVLRGYLVRRIFRRLQP